MNIQTGDIFRLSGEEDLKRLKSVYGDYIQEVPEKYADEAEKALDGKEHGRVDMCAVILRQKGKEQSDESRSTY